MFELHPRNRVERQQPKSGYLGRTPRHAPLVQRELEVVGRDPVDGAVHHTIGTLVHRGRKPAPCKIPQQESERLAAPQSPARFARRDAHGSSHGTSLSPRASHRHPATRDQRRTIEPKHPDALQWSHSRAVSRQQYPDPVGPHRRDFPAQGRDAAAVCARQLRAEFAPHERNESRAQVEARQAEPLGLTIQREALGRLLRVELMIQVFEKSVPTHR